MTEEDKKAVEDLVYAIVDLARNFRKADPNWAETLTDDTLGVLTAVALSAFNQGIVL